MAQRLLSMGCQDGVVTGVPTSWMVSMVMIGPSTPKITKLPRNFQRSLGRLIFRFWNGWILLWSKAMEIPLAQKNILRFKPKYHLIVFAQHSLYGFGQPYFVPNIPTTCLMLPHGHSVVSSRQKAVTAREERSQLLMVPY